MPKIEEGKPKITRVGIDPGLTGGISFLTGGMPGGFLTTFKLENKTDQDLLLLFESVKPVPGKHHTYAVIEKITPMPTRMLIKGVWQSSILKSTCLLYGNYRMLCTVLAALRIPYEAVEPKKWQKALGVSPKKKGETKSKWKNRLRAHAQQLSPNYGNITLAVADSVLLAHYAWKCGWDDER